MPIQPGDKLGPYEILAPIGKGGMGEVYSALDTRLNREVAIKVSAERFNDRFEREARAVASLNHANICTLHDVGPNYLVMELIEGDTLIERIRQGPIPIAEALPIARQIADALDAAHSKGIIHRDLKPGNIKIKPDGQVKVLDFGLAKLGGASTAPPGTPSDDSPTLTLAMTEAGVIMGTASYMAPEQARGKQVDKRADIFAFGVVLYEMLTGERLFKGDDLTETLASVVKDKPDLDKAPFEIRKLLAKCLEKDPKKRLRDIGDAMELIQSRDREEVFPPVQRAPSQSRLGWVAAGIATLIASTLGFLYLHQPAPPENPVLIATIPPPDGQDFDFGSVTLPALSPDGNRLVFAATPKSGKRLLWSRRLDSPTAQPLTGTEDALFPFWSPDSRYVGFAQDNKLKKLDIQGGAPVSITDVPSRFQGGAWSPQGVIIFGMAASPLMRVSATGGTASPATALEAGDSSGQAYPWFLPDGRHFLYTTYSGGDVPIRMGSLDSPGKPGKVVGQTSSNVAYAQGHLLYARQRTLLAQPFDVDQLKTSGEAAPLAEALSTQLINSRTAEFTASLNGLLVYRARTTGNRAQLVWKDRQGKPLGNVGEPVSVFGGLNFSPDGKRLVGHTRDRDSDFNIWIYDLVRGIPTRFTFDPAEDLEAVWAPDGGTIYFSSTRGASTDLFRKAASGASAEAILLADKSAKYPTTVSPDGKFLIFYALGEKTQNDLWVLPLMEGAKPQPRIFLQTPFDETRAQFSPDGRWVAYVSNESGQEEIYATQFPTPSSKRQISSGGGMKPRWSRDGKELFYVTPAGALMAARITSGNGTLEVGSVQMLFDGLITNRGMTYEVSLDGKKFLVAEESASVSPPLTLVQNWAATLKK